MNEVNEDLIENEENQSFYDDEADQQPPPDIVAYNELRSCADLFRMYDKGILDINPDFQRDSVWKSAGQTRFIDSLIKQLPIPSMCFSLDYKTQKWQVIDGLQRMSAIIRFMGDKEWRLSDLDDIDKKLAEEWVLILEEHKLLKVVYPPFGDAIIKSNKVEENIKKNGNVLTYLNEPSDVYSLSDNIINSLLVDNTGVLWIGTESQGCNLLDLYQKKFIHIRNIPNKVNSLSDNLVTAITGNKQGTIWVGTAVQGLDEIIFDDFGDFKINHYEISIFPFLTK